MAFDQRLVLLDLQMPGMSGLDVLTHIRAMPSLSRHPATTTSFKNGQCSKGFQPEEKMEDKVRAHVISPSYVKETPVFERFGVGGRGETAEKKAGLGLPTPKDLAPLTLFLCGPDATKMTGQVLSVNGGINT